MREILWVTSLTYMMRHFSISHRGFLVFLSILLLHTLPKRVSFFSYWQWYSYLSAIYTILMQKKNKLFLILIILVFFVFLWWKWLINGIFYFQLLFLLRPFGYYEWELAYNTLLSKQWADTGSLVILLEHSLSWREVDRAELLWDALARWSGSEAKAISWYEQSLSIEERPRVREKILLLQSQSSSWWWQDTNSSQSPQESTQKEWTGTNDAIKISEQRIQEDANNRTKYLEKPGQKYILQNTIEFLNLDDERVDW